MTFTFEELQPHKIAYLRHTGPYGSSNAQLMDTLKRWAMSNQLLNDQSTLFGIAHDNPETTLPENCRYDVCLVISDVSLIPDAPIHLGHIGGGTYAVFVIEHTAEAIQNAWFGIFCTLNEKGYSFDDSRPVLERYAAEMVTRHLCEICIPV